MKRTTAALVMVLVASVLGRGHADPKPGGFMSANVTWVANIPLDGPGVGARVVKVNDPLLGARTRLYVTGVPGLSIYDVTEPLVPVLLGHLPYPHFQNEDVSVSDDGSLTIISADTTGNSAVFDTSVPQAPRLLARMPGNDHTMTCAVPSCAYVYGSNGNIYDLTNPAAPVRLPQRWFRSTVTGSHDLYRDAVGYLFSDSNPRLMLDPRANPASPTLVTTGAVPSNMRLAYQHNSIRPRAAEWVPRPAGDTDASLRTGELLIASGETNFTVSCNGTSNGPIATWSIKNFDKGAAMTPLAVFRPLENGNYADGNPRANALGCSSHWFTERDNIIAAGWYEHGTRFIRVDPATGALTEVGHFQPVVGSASGAYWLNDEFVYTVDYIRGIDILKFDRNAAPPTDEEIAASWLAKLDAPEAQVREQEQFACKLGAAVAA